MAFQTIFSKLKSLFLLLVYPYSNYLFILCYFFSICILIVVLFFSNRYSFLKFILLLCLAGYIMAFTKVLIIYQIYHTWIHPSPLLSFTSPSILVTVSTDIMSAFTYMCIHYLHYNHPPIPLPTTSPSHQCQLPPSRVEHVPPSCSQILWKK
jgi:hypothetical protein